MKKRVIFLLTCVALAASLQSAYAGDDETTKSTYYGAEASNSTKNPCKGATIRKCGTIETSYSVVEKNPYGILYKVETVTKNPDGMVINSAYKQMTVPVTMTLQEYVNANWTIAPNATIPTWELKTGGDFKPIGE